MSVVISPLYATQSSAALPLAHTDSSTRDNPLPSKEDGQANDGIDLNEKTFLNNKATFPSYHQIQFQSISDQNPARYQPLEPNVSGESKGSIYYTSYVKAKNILSRIFVGDHVSARMDAFHNTEIPFFARGSGVTTEVSTQSTNLSASLFKSDLHSTGHNSVGNIYHKQAQPLVGDTKLALAIPYFPKLKLFGGYSYNRGIVSRLTKGPSFGFQADVFDHVKVDTTFIRPHEGKSAAKVLLSFNMRLDQIRF